MASRTKKNVVELGVCNFVTEGGKVYGKSMWASKKDAAKKINSLAKLAKLRGQSHPNAIHACEKCGYYHLWTRGEKKGRF